MADERETGADSSELRIFVAETLNSIMLAVADVRDTASISSPKNTGKHTFKAPELVEFDIAVTAARSAKGGGGLKLQVFSVGVNADGEKTSETSTVSRIRFAIPRTFLKRGENE